MIDLDRYVLTEVEINKIKNISPIVMPINPSSQNWSGNDIRKYMAKFIFDASDGLIHYLNNKFAEIFSFQSNLNLQNESSVVKYKAKSKEIISKGQLVMVDGSEDGVICVRVATIDCEKTKILGVAIENAGLNSLCEVVSYGIIYGLNTSNLTSGSNIYQSETIDGELSIVNNNGFFIGICITADNLLGSILVRIGIGETTHAEGAIITSSIEPKNPNVNTYWNEILEED